MNTPKAPWLKYFGDMPAHLDYPTGSMYEAVKESAKTKKKMNSVAYEFQGKKTNYKQFFNKIETLGKAYKSIGINEGDMVTVCMPNTPQGVDTFYALNRIGAVPAMIHPLSAVGEIAFYINKTQSKAVLVLDLFYEKVLEALKQVNYPVKVVVAHIKDELPFPLNMLYPLTVKDKPASLPKDNKDVIDWPDFISGGKKVTLTNELPKAEDTAVILFSGGTTGTSKGIQLTNMNMNALAAQVAANAGFTMEGLRMFSVMPLFHGFGLGVGIHTALMASGTCIIIPQFTIKTYARDVKKYKPNVIVGVPTLYEALLRSDGFNYDLSFLRGMFCGGDSLSVELKKKVDKFLKEHNATIQVREGYGTTECVTASCLTPYDMYREGSIGIPLSDTYYTIVNPNNDTEIPYGEEGEICICGPTVMKGYLNNAEETASTLRRHADGNLWLHTGDLGYMDEDGFVYYKQRMKRLIIVSGINVYPSQVENAIDAHPDVLLSCAVGIPDPYKMHVVKAFVVLRQGVEPSDKIKEEIIENCKKNVSRYGVPREIEFRTELPKTLVGKVAYRVLEEEEAAKYEEKKKAEAEENKQ
ncbi:MAG: AMP-binding protein [Eubacterium coprostanoligenes]|uniref:AMP-binding protein n=1 Tax=Eubacterium coprostanoligenes TaxID=290054 RepID=UPI0023552993|nr:AMP-binding protein [Eubacterium coprostanoligenes]MCI7264275.1 AMP-binding protein [Eubacterium coprostanoligenes]